MSSSALHQTPAALSGDAGRRVRLLEARLSGGNGGGGSTNASNGSSLEAPQLNNAPPGTGPTYIPIMDIKTELHSSMRPYVLQTPPPPTGVGGGSDQQPQHIVMSSPQSSLEMLLAHPLMSVGVASTAGPGEPLLISPKEESNVSVRSASSEHNSGEPQMAENAPGDVRNLSASSNSVSQMSADPTTLPLPLPDGRKRKRGKNKEPSTSPVAKPAKNARSSGSTSEDRPPARSRIAASDSHTVKSNMAAGGSAPVSSGSSSLARSSTASNSASSIPVPPPGSRSPLYPPGTTAGLYMSPAALSQQQGSGPSPFLPSNSHPVLNGLTGGSASKSSALTVTAVTQTDLTLKDMTSLLSKQSSDKAEKEKTAQTFEQKIAEMSKEIVKLKHKLETSDGRLLKCIEKEKQLLSEKSSMEKKSARSKSVHNRMKLGQFVTQREGANFEEKFLDGYSFNELNKRSEELQAEKEELDRRRKLLLKRKPTDKTVKKNASSVTAAATASTSSGVQAVNDADATSTLPQGAVSQPFAGALVGVTSNNANGPAAANWSTDFIQPEVREWTWSDYSQEDEILKLRTAQLKKDEQDCATELEKMERERLIHIRELKRIFNEDQSVFKNNPVLNSRYLLLTLIGKGGFSEVHKAFDLEEQRYVAVKVHQLIKEWKDEKKANYIKHALREYHVHKHLTHPRVVKLFDVFEIDSNSFATVLEYVEGNDLDFYLKQQKTIPEREARIMISQVVSALKYFNELKPPIIHYDLKPGNILLGHGNSSGEIKVTDFGLSKVCDDEHYDSDFGMDLTSQGAGTYWYLPPEVFETSNTPKISSKVDVWSVGVIFYQMLYGRKPYGDKQSQREVLQNFTILNARDVEFPTKPQISLEAKNFIRRCLTLRKDDRPEVRQLCSDEYLQLGTKLTKGNPATPNSNNPAPTNHYG